MATSASALPRELVDFNACHVESIHLQLDTCRQHQQSLVNRVHVLDQSGQALVPLLGGASVEILDATLAKLQHACLDVDDGATTARDIALGAVSQRTVLFDGLRQEPQFGAFRARMWTSDGRPP